jgi:hypothetical protein
MDWPGLGDPVMNLVYRKENAGSPVLENPILPLSHDLDLALIPHLAPAEQRFWSAVAPLVEREVSEAKIAGFCGLIARSLSSPLLVSDVTSLWLPGLAALGLHAEIEPLQKPELRSVLRERLRRRVPVPLLAVEPVEPGVQMPDPRITDVVVATGMDQIGPTVGSTAPGETPLSLQGFPDHFTHLVRIRRNASPGMRSANALAALLRLTACGLGDHNRRPVAPGDAVVRATAAEFLTQLARAGRTPFHVRLRRAAASYRSPEPESGIQAAVEYLLEAICIKLLLPPSVRSALTVPHPLNRIEIQELIYLARAGTREMRAIAGARLALAPDADARATVAILQDDSDPLVRSALVVRRE